MIVTAAKLFKNPFTLYVLAAFCLFLSSCSTVKNFPDKPFVYESNIAINGKFSTDERKELTSKLQDQLHDSIQVKKLQKLVLWNTLKNPPVYDSANADKSVIYMRALLNSLGYYRDTITYDTSLHVVQSKNGTQQRITVNFDVYPGKLIKLDSVSYNFNNDTLQTVSQSTKDTLQQISDASMKDALLKKGEPFAKALISTDLNRLTDMFRNNGYLRFSFDELVAIWDTVGIALLRPTLDPIEQAQQLDELRKRRENPIADLEVRLRYNPDTSHLIRYRVGEVYIYPDLSIDSANYIPKEDIVNGYRIISYHNLYKPRVVAENVYLNKGDLYRQSNYLKTLNRFNSIGSWRLVSIDQVPRGVTDTVDFIVRLTPAAKYSFNANIEGSQNFGGNNNLLASGNIIGLNLGLQNRNFARAANTANTNFRFATEILSNKFVQTKQVSLSHSIYFPRLIPRFNFIPVAWRDNYKTVFNFNTSYTSRKDFFDVTSLNGSWGYEFNWKNKLFAIRFPNIEYSYLRRGVELDTLIMNNKSYEFIFPSGLVSSVISSLTLTGGRKDVTNLTRFNFESSGLMAGYLHNSFMKNNLHRFLRFDAEFRQTIKIRRSYFAWRTFAGAGYQMGSGFFKYNTTLPFFKSYFAGGANSMRAWALRKLGPGSTIKSFDNDKAPERYGDMRLEANAEYRFYLANINGVLINSAVFTDIGNIWTLRNIEGFENGKFKFKNLWNDIAVGAGTGLRIDFGIFLIRLDYAYKLKDPSPDLINAHLQNKFFPYRGLGDGQFQLGVTYPF